MSGGQPKYIEFEQSLGGGEYDAEIIFSANGQEQRDGFGFNVRTSMFNVWMEMPPGQMNFEPGQNVTIWTYVAHPNGTSAEGVNVEIIRIDDPRIWDDVERNMTGRIVPVKLSATTGSDGMAQLKFTLNESYTGELDIAVKEYSGNQVNYMMLMVSGYDVQFYRPWDKWRYMPDENYTADIYVYKNGNPVENVTAYLKSRYTDGGDWNNIIHDQSLGLTDSNGHIYINYKLDSSKYNQNGHYMIEVDIGNGAARVEDWFKVESFIVEERTYGEDSYQREVSPEEVVVIDVYVKNVNGVAIAANVTLLELKNPMNWQQSLDYPEVLEDSPGQYTNVSTTDASGRATLKLKAPMDSNEYIAIINVTTGTDSTMTEAWFKVMQYSVTVQMMCADGTSTCSDPNLKSAGGNVVIKVEVTGNVNETRACLREIRNIYTGVMTSYWQCNDTVGVVNNSNEVFLNFAAPMETGEYDAVINIEVNKDGSYYEFAKEEWRWFRVMGEGGYEMNAWIEPHSIWPSTNASAYVELWNPMEWEDVKEDEICSSINITEIKDTYTWTIVKTGDQITQWIEEQEMCGDMPCGPPGVQLKFEVPDLSPGEYEAKIVAECDGTTYQRYTWFQINAFQVSSLMPGKVKANQTVPVWLKVTAYNGTPLTNIDVNIREIRNDWTWNIVRPINEIKNPNSYGEVEYNLTTPEQSGQYILEMEVVDQSSGLMQRVSRWFRIAGMDVIINISGRSEFYLDQDINFTVNVSDAMTGEPIEDAQVRVNVWGHSYEDKMMEEPENDTQPMGINIEPIEIQTGADGIASGTISKEDIKLGEFGLCADVCTDTKGCAFIEESFVVTNYSLGVNITGGIDYNKGDNINIQIQANYSDEITTLDETYEVEVCLENMMMKGGDENETQSAYNCTNTSLDGSGFANLNLGVPDNVSSGPAVLFISLLNSTDDEIDWAPYLVILHAEGGVNYTFDETGNSDMLVVDSSEMFGVSLSMNSENAQLSQSVMHLKKTGDSVPMSQMMGGGPESNKEDWYESAMFLNATGDLHVKVLAREEPGIYYSFLAFNLKGSGMMMGPENMLDVAFLNYRVI